MKSPKVSVLVPTYNGAPFLGECLDSVLAQDFEDCEIVIIDDDSRDGTRALIEQYAAKDKRIRWGKNQSNLGLAQNFNECLRAAQGEFIKFVLQDDLLLRPTVLRQMVAELEADPDVKLAGCASHVIDASSQIISHRDHFAAGVTDGREVIMRCLETAQNLVGEPTMVMFRKKDMERGFNQNYRQLVDQECWFYLLEHGKFSHLPEPLGAFRRHDGQQTVVNRRDPSTHIEDARLLEEYATRPWFRKLARPEKIYEMIHRLRARKQPQAIKVAGQLERQMTLRNYGLYWMSRKLRRPFENLHRSIKKRLPRLSPK